MKPHCYIEAKPKPNHILLGSLDVRKRKIETIQTQNMQILQRLSSVSPTYNVDKWRSDRSKKEKMLSNICRFPHIFKESDIYHDQNSSQLDS